MAVGHVLKVRDVDYDPFYEKKRLEDETSTSTGPVNIKNVVIPNWKENTVLDATATPKTPKNLGIGRIVIEEMPDDNYEFTKQNLSCEGHGKHKNIAAPCRLVVDSDDVVAETMKTHNDKVEGASKVIK